MPAPRDPRAPKPKRCVRVLNTNTRNITAVAMALVLVVAVIVVITHEVVGPGTPKNADVVVKIRTTSRYGNILVTRRGMTIYLYQLDTKNHSNCVGFCLHMWPPLTVPHGLEPIGPDVPSLGVINRPGGIRQVTYEGMPLYLYVLDDYPGQITGVGDSWNVVRVRRSP
jgi:predicted lipoprotein with Yx(FWY)xxD motif